MSETLLEELRRKAENCYVYDKPVLAKAMERAADEIDGLRALLTRIRQWDHLDGAGDGPFWKREIDIVLGGGTHG